LELVEFEYRKYIVLKSTSPGVEKIMIDNKEKIIMKNIYNIIYDYVYILNQNVNLRYLVNNLIKSVETYPILENDTRRDNSHGNGKRTIDQVKDFESQQVKKLRVSSGNPLGLNESGSRIVNKLRDFSESQQNFPGHCLRSCDNLNPSTNIRSEADFIQTGFETVPIEIDSSSRQEKINQERSITAQNFENKDMGQKKVYDQLAEINNKLTKQDNENTKRINQPSFSHYQLGLNQPTFTYSNNTSVSPMEILKSDPVFYQEKDVERGRSPITQTESRSRSQSPASDSDMDLYIDHSKYKTVEE